MRARRRNWWLAAWPGLTPTVRISIIAGALSAAKVALFAVGSGVFLGAYEARGLAWLYLGLALLAGSSALLLVPHLERSRADQALGWLLALTAGATLLVVTASVAGLPWTAALLLIVAHLYNISSEIMLWLVAAAWLPPPEVRRATVWIYVATALGGVMGGVGVERLLPFGPNLAVTVITLVAFGYAALWLWASKGLAASRDPRGAAGEDGDSALSTCSDGPWRVLVAQPLGPLLGASSFMLTLLWVVTEYLCLAFYRKAYAAGPDHLAAFLALLYAGLQVVELACIVLFTGPVTRCVSPAWRSTLFPLGALLTLLLMRSQPDMATVVLAHAYTEAASNGLFDPVHASNFAAVPLRYQARIRAVSEGICYPAGMAAGGLALLLGPAEPSGLHLPAILAAFLFVMVGAYTGIMVTPSLLNALGLTAEIGPAPRRASLRAAARALRPWARRARLRHRLLLARGDRRAPGLRRQIERADRRALAQVFKDARRCDPSDALAHLEVLLDSRSPERRALVAETVLSLPVRRLFLPFLPALRRRYLP
ncbi:MAG: hypothetical protein ACJ8H8_09770 [Geminicoccaceae bacterium]